MFLLRCKARGFDRVTFEEDKLRATLLAKQWVGEHHPIDGCSSEPQAEQYVGRWKTWRSSSFGTREAIIYDPQPGTDATFDIV